MLFAIFKLLLVCKVFGLSLYYLTQHAWCSKLVLNKYTAKPTIKSLVQLSDFETLTLGTFPVWSLSMNIFNLIDHLFYGRWLYGKVVITKTEDGLYQWEEEYYGLRNKSSRFSESISIQDVENWFDDVPKLINAHNPVFVRRANEVVEHVGTIFEVSKSNLAARMSAAPKMSAAERLKMLKGQRPTVFAQ